MRIGFFPFSPQCVKENINRSLVETATVSAAFFAFVSVVVLVQTSLRSKKLVLISSGASAAFAARGAICFRQGRMSSASPDQIEKISFEQLLDFKTSESLLVLPSSKQDGLARYEWSVAPSVAANDWQKALGLDVINKRHNPTLQDRSFRYSGKNQASRARKKVIESCEKAISRPCRHLVYLLHEAIYEEIEKLSEGDSKTNYLKKFDEIGENECPNQVFKEYSGILAELKGFCTVQEKACLDLNTQVLELFLRTTKDYLESKSIEEDASQEEGQLLGKFARIEKVAFDRLSKKLEKDYQIPRPVIFCRESLADQGELEQHCTKIVDRFFLLFDPWKAWRTQNTFDVEALRWYRQLGGGDLTLRHKILAMGIDPWDWETDKARREDAMRYIFFRANGIIERG